ncbi:HNH endonuclease signature motif containing protein [Azorhizobium sp. AG788]|uniref:HNH endonuclease signature motif containing protein n=1 Tax=Azorhizobium sp. AG788 TaxID=2183897 RepID=UPI00313A42F1
MPRHAPRICGCGHRIASGERCPCERRRKAEADARRPSARARGYDSQWDKARAAFLAHHPSCARCGTAATVVDHVTPHKGDKRLFWSRENWQPLCKPCHDGAKQSEERRARLHLAREF